MLDVSRSLHRNRLLAALSPADFALLQPDLQPVTLKPRMHLEVPNRPIDHVYFIEDGIASVVTVEAHEQRTEVGLIGREGMSGTAIVLANDRSPHSTYMQVGGCGQRTSAATLRKAMTASGSLHDLLLRYVQSFMVQTAHTASANASAKLDERLARWILMADDRVRRDALPLTHELLALMLGVRRSGVTEALHGLKKRGVLDVARGRIIVLDRKGIEQIAGHSYGVPEAEYSRLIG
jgi:CRP-like cAMP-binding protein